MSTDDRVVVTIKYPGNNKPWAVFHGADVDHTRGLIGQAFGFSIEGLTLHEVTVIAQQQVEGVGHVVKTLGGTPVPDTSTEGSAWDQVSEAKRNTAPAETPEVNPLVSKLAACTTQPEVKQLWAENRPEFDADEYLTAAMKSRYKELAP
jgi:hypothetical protein